MFDEVENLISYLTPIEAALKEQDRPINQNIVISSYTVIFLIQLQQKFLAFMKETSHQDLKSNIVMEFNRLLDKPDIPFRFVKDYADALFVTANYLNEKVKAETNHPASYWINAQLLIQSKRLLNQSSLSIKQIANACHFKTPGHFYPFFQTPYQTYTAIIP